MRVSLPAWAAPFAAVLLVSFSALWVYRNVLWTGSEIYPWGSDTWSHLFKALYLSDEIGKGNWYPTLLPSWYMGLEMVRYHAPLTYYLLAGLDVLSGDIFRAGNLFLLLAAWFGAQSMLLFKRWLGWGGATVAGILYVWLPDNLRVAFSEGNLPRVLASAFLPVALFSLFLILLESSNHSARSRFAAFLGVSFPLALVVLSHAMMGAIFSACLGLITILAVAFRIANVRSALTGLLSILAGLGLSAWWLIPSLVGGIGDINSAAVTEALERFPATFSLNPLVRLENQEAFYLDLALCAAAVISLLRWPRLTPLARLLLVSGLVTVTITFDFVFELYTALPLHNELWPVRFTSFSGPALLLGVLASLRVWPWKRAAVLVCILLALDSSPSLALARTSTAPSDLIRVSKALRDLPGWRVAVADSSLLGSKPSYLLTQISGREQVFGWAYQGAHTARAVAALNESMEQGFTGYALDRLNLMGVDDVLVASTLPSGSQLGSALLSAGWARQSNYGVGDLYHRNGVPRATQLLDPVLGIGSGAYDAGLIFPVIMVGPSDYIDDYRPSDLAAYGTIYASRFSWHSQTSAEQLLLAYARSGGHVIIDVNGTPEDGFARVPKFLDVYGEPVVLSGAVTLSDQQAAHQLSNFGSYDAPWHTFVPQGNLTPVSTFDYMGQTANGIAVRNEGTGRITFLGLNLTYHSVVARDQTAIQILEGVFGTKAEEPATRPAVPLVDYQAGVNGYHFGYELAQDSWLLLPVAHLDGLVATLDGKPIETLALDTLVTFRAPAGHHEVKLTMATTLIQWVGAAISLLTALGIICFAIWKWLRRRSLPAALSSAARPATLVVAASLLFLLTSAAAYAASIAIDGNFGDWNGQANITDPQGDSSDPNADISALYWANNPGDSTMYWMIERYPPPQFKDITYLLHIDTNNDGNYEQTVTVTYNPNPNKASVTVDHGGTGAGDTRSAGGRRVEIGVPFSNLGITAGSVIRFYIESIVQGQSQVADTTSSVQMSAVDILETPLLIVLAGIAVLGLWRFAARKPWTS